MNRKAMVRPLVRAASVGVLMVIVALLGSTPAGAEVPPLTHNVVAVDSDGQVLAENPLLRRGAHVVITASGFRPREAVEIHTDLHARSATADHLGSVQIPLVISGDSTGGQHTVVVIEMAGTSGSSGATRTRGNAVRVVVTIPRVGIFPYRVPSLSSTDAPLQTDSSATDAAAGPSLAMTGLDLAGALLTAASALVGGAYGVAGSRRRIAPTAQT